MRTIFNVMCPEKQWKLVKARVRDLSPWESGLRCPFSSTTARVACYATLGDQSAVTSVLCVCHSQHMTHADPIRGSLMISPIVGKRHCLLWDLKQYDWLKSRVSSGHPSYDIRAGLRRKPAQRWENLRKIYMWFLTTCNLLNITITETLTLNIFVNGLHKRPINSFSST